MVFIDVKERPPSSYFSLDSIFEDESYTFSHVTNKNHFTVTFNEAYNKLDIGTRVADTIDKRPNLTPYQETENSSTSNIEEFSLRSKNYNAIKACCGDDCITASNCSAYMPAIIAVCEDVLEVTISEPDLGNSHRISSYTQGFILAPLSPVSNFSSVNDFIGSKAIPWTFDLPDAKRYSGVRKQSDEGTDFSSKYIYIAQAADWVDKDWITFDLHQLGKLIAMLTLDFRSARSHPYVFKAEGGCGSFPPWGNVATAVSSFHFYQRGKECSALLLAIEESTKIRKNQKAPSESDYLQLIHQAQNSHLWTALYQKFKELKSAGYNHLQVRDMLDQLMKKQAVPQDLVDKSVEVFPRSTLVGMLIAQMRNFGLIMTELDVMNHLAKKAKFQHMTGVEPLGPIFEKEEQEIRLNKRKGNSFVLQLSTALSTDKEKLSDDRRIARERIIEILLSYYASHPGHFLSSFIYADGIRIYRSADVVDFTDHDERKMFIESLDLPVIKLPSHLQANYQPTNFTQTASFEKAVLFAKDLNLSILNDNSAELPFIGAADPLVLRECIRVHGEVLKSEIKVNDHVIIVVTEDKYLVWSVAQYMRQKYNVCILYIAGKWMYDWISRDPKKERQYQSNDWRKKERVFHSFPVSAFGKSRRLSNLDCEFILQVANLQQQDNVQVSFVFDFPNIRRRMGLISRFGNTTVDQGHTWLSRDSVHSVYGLPVSIGFRYFDDMADFMAKPKNPLVFHFKRDDHIRVLRAPIDRPI